jgi:hypothetical protein
MGDASGGAATVPTRAWTNNRSGDGGNLKRPVALRFTQTIRAARQTSDRTETVE